MDSWEESNRAVAREFLGDRTGQLFRAPRKTRNTTTEQRLDPARVDHFLTLLELPERLHPRCAGWSSGRRRPAETPTGVQSPAADSMRRIRLSPVPRENLVPTTSPLSRPLDLILHIGTGRAGSSSIQFFLRDNRERLGELGVLYPRTPGGARHARLGLFVKSKTELESSPEWYRQKQSDPASFRKAFRRRLFSEIEDSGLSRVLLSDEILFGSSEQALRRLSPVHATGSPRACAWSHTSDARTTTWCSRYQQGVKIGWVARLA